MVWYESLSSCHPPPPSHTTQPPSTPRPPPFHGQRHHLRSTAAVKLMHYDISQNRHKHLGTPFLSTPHHHHHPCTHAHTHPYSHSSLDRFSEKNDATEINFPQNGATTHHPNPSPPLHPFALCPRLRARAANNARCCCFIVKRNVDFHGASQGFVRCRYSSVWSPLYPQQQLLLVGENAEGDLLSARERENK